MLDTETLSAFAGGTPPDLNALLDQLGNEDPRLRMLLQLMPQSQSAAVTDEPTARVVPRRVLERAARLRAAYDSLAERNAALADALGACPLCWGEEPGCRRCEGRGVPGSVDADPDRFRELIVPALRRMD